jgi:hypothetical protein
MAPVTRGETVVEVAKTGLSFLVDVVQFVPIPYASQVVSLVASIVSMVEVRAQVCRLAAVLTPTFRESGTTKPDSCSL